MGQSGEEEEVREQPSLKLTLKLADIESGETEKHRRKKKKKRKSDEDRKKKKKEKKQKDCFSDSNMSEERTEETELPRAQPLRQSITPRKNLELLSQVILTFLNELEKNDPNDVFAQPVTDNIAPGYSSMIRNPMDFSTIRNKTKHLAYESLAMVRADCELMCKNCLKYNTDDTPFHTLAVKMLKEIERVVQVKRAERILKRDNYELQKIYEVLEIDQQTERTSTEESEHESATDSYANSPRSKRDWAPEKKSHMELTEPVLDHEDAVSHTDSMYEEDVLRFALRAAAEARARLNAKYPKRPRIGYLQFDHNKTIYSTISDGSGQASFNVEIKPLEIVTETVDQHIEPIEYLTYGPYGSYIPTYDSRLDDLVENNSKLKTKEQLKGDQMEKESLLKIYGGEKELYYVQSLQSFVADMPEPVIDAVETILNRLTDGLHETTRLNKRKSIKMEPNPLDLLTLKEDGVNVDFLDAFHPESESSKKAQFIDKTLGEAAQLMIEINNELNPAADEEEKKIIKNKIGILNSMLKTMIPLYNTPTLVKPTDANVKSPVPAKTQIIRVTSSQNSQNCYKTEPKTET